MPRKDGTDTPKEARFRQLVRELLDQGIKPTPMEVHRRQGDNRFVVLGNKTMGPSFCGGPFVAIRREEFKRAGWTEGKQGNNLRWTPPKMVARYGEDFPAGDVIASE